MKLSAIARFGFRHVKGLRLLRVLHPHQVSAKGAFDSSKLELDTDETFDGAAPLAKGSPQGGRDAVYAVEGDLAIEVGDAKTGEVVGYSYLTGAAIQCMGYEIAPHRFEPGRLVRLGEVERLIRDMGAMSSKGDFDEHLKQLIDHLQRSRHSDEDVAVFEVVVGDDYKRVAQAVLDFWSKYEPGATESETPAWAKTQSERRCHLIGAIWRKKLKPSSFRKKASEHVGMHLQPPRHSNDYAATPFQTALLVGATG